MIVIVFDVDGTLLDTKEGIRQAYNHALNEIGIKDSIVDDDVLKYIGPPVPHVFEKCFLLESKEVDVATKIYRQVYVDKYVKESSLYEGMDKVLNYLKNNKIHICIATNKTEQQIEKVLDIFDLREYFDYVYAAKVDGSLTKTDMLLQIKEKYLNVDYYMVGDTEGDYIAARNAGYKFIAAEYGYGDVSKCNSWKKIKKPVELCELSF